MVSLLDQSHELDAYIEKDVHTLLWRLSHCESKRYMRMKSAHDELLMLLITIIVLLVVILFIVIWKLC